MESRMIFKLQFFRSYVFAILVSMVMINGLSEERSCPYAQFELFRSSKTPLADECETHLVIQHGQCKGATVHIKALGIYTTVVDVQLKTPHCAGKELVEIALLNRTVKVPKKYFGYEKSGCFEFPASHSLTPHEAISRFERSDKAKKVCFEGIQNHVCCFLLCIHNVDFT